MEQDWGSYHDLGVSFAEAAVHWPLCDVTKGLVAIYMFSRNSVFSFFFYFRQLTEIIEILLTVQMVRTTVSNMGPLRFKGPTRRSSHIFRGAANVFVHFETPLKACRDL